MQITYVSRRLRTNNPRRHCGIFLKFAKPPAKASVRGAKSYVLPYVSRQLRSFNRPRRKLVLATAPPLVLTGKLKGKSGQSFDVTLTLT